MAARQYRSWSRLPSEDHAFAVDFDGADGALPAEGDLLPFGGGRTYGDTCINPRGGIIDTRRLADLHAFDAERGLLRCGAGATLAQVLDHVVPRGWFLPVCPGTRAVTVGGAIAHDVHGKNQARTGTFGCHVERLALVRSDGARLVCSAAEHPELFAASIGGLGLTGLIEWAELRLRAITSPYMHVEVERLAGLDDYLARARQPSAGEFELAWVDSFARGRPGERILAFRGEHAEGAPGELAERPRRRPRLPLATPALLFNRATLRAFNLAYYHVRHRRARARQRKHYMPFLFPQDSAHPSNRLYGRRGVYAYHCLVPSSAAADTLPLLLERIARPGEQSLITVLKTFGAAESPGLLSFSGPGISLACGFPNEGAATLALLADLDAHVRAAGGKLYPAKDARMPAAMFRSSFPRWRAFGAHVDPRFSSRFWRRVCEVPA